MKIVLDLDKSTYERLENLAIIRGKDKSDIAISALVKYLEEANLGRLIGTEEKPEKSEPLHGKKYHEWKKRGADLRAPH